MNGRELCKRRPAGIAGRLLFSVREIVFIVIFDVEVIFRTAAAAQGRAILQLLDTVQAAGNFECARG